MIILDKPYVSDFLVETIKENNFKVLDNEIARNYFEKSDLSDASCIEKDERFYTNSENSINWIFKNMPNSTLTKMIDICKQKSKFRSLLQGIYPNYFFKSFTFEDLLSGFPNSTLIYGFFKFSESKNSSFLISFSWFAKNELGQ